MRAVPLILILIATAGIQPTAAQSKAPMPIGTFLGGVPAGEVTSEAIPITILDAIGRALEHNLGVLTAEQALGRANGVHWRALADLLPNVNAHILESRQKINLQAFGFGFGAFGDAFAGVPTLVGPFNNFDARVSVSQRVLDLHALYDARAEAHNVTAAQLTSRSARDFVIHVAGNSYIQALAASARSDTAVTQRETAETLYNQAVDLKAGGLVAGIDVLRAQVQLSTATQRATASANEFEKAKLQLARIIGLPLGQRFTLDARLPELPDEDLSLESAVDRAYRSRPDYQAALVRVQAAEAARQAASGESLPSVAVNADYGVIGLSPADSQATYALSGVVNIPIFQGNRRRGRLAEADADLRDRRAEADDLKASIYYEIRMAFLDLQATTEQLAVATKGRDLAAQQLTQARDRFAAGVGSNIEVVQAQDAVSIANEQYIAAQYGFALAKGALVRGVGSSDEMLRQLLGGAR